MTTLCAILEIFIPPNGQIPSRIAKRLCSKETAPLIDTPSPLEECTKGIWECVQTHPRWIFPKLNTFQHLVIHPWREEPSGKENTKIYASDVLASGWKGTLHSPFNLSIRVTFSEVSGS